MLERDYRIENEKQFENAQALLVDLKTAKARVTGRIEQVKKPLNQARAAILDLERDLVPPFTDRIAAVTRAINVYRNPPPPPVDRSLNIPQRPTMNPVATSLRTQAASLPTEERQLLEDVAAQLETSGPLPTAAPAITDAGLSEVVTWKAEVADLRLLLLSVLEGKAPLELVAVNLSGCHALADQWKDLLGQTVPGLKAVRQVDYRRKG